MNSRLAIVTCQNIPEIDVDETITLQRFAEAGFEVSLVAWDDISINWSNYDAALIRSTWNYPEFPEQYSHWVVQVSESTRLFNSAVLIAPNIHKSYLLSLSDTGVPIVPTLMPKSFSEAQAWLLENRYTRFVLKPAIGAGSWMTDFFNIGEIERAERFFAEIQAENDPICQPFMESVSNGGERSLIYIDGNFTHKIIKQPRFIGQEESVSDALPVELHEAQIGNLVINTLPEKPLYARVDLIEDSGELLLSEMELIEPSLFFRQNPAALDDLVNGVKSRLSTATALELS
ncbi:MAG: hypothetical protein KF836_10520 [Fimbriimonadaceae bacterium]|nr:hypothetical protein [Fimbriimonadaceae bacterium]